MTAFQESLGIELPIVQAPMAGVQGSALAIAVAEAGGLGSLPCAMLSADSMRAELATIAAATKKPINVNFFCHEQQERDADADRRYRGLLAPYYAEYGLDPDAPSTAPARVPFSAQAADVLAEFEPAIVSFHFGLPADDLLARVRSWGAKVLASATTVEEARWLAARGVDAIVAQGIEAGGHRGTFLPGEPGEQIGTFALVPQIVDAVRVPVIAAGGIADARGVAAAMALGASAVQVGTAYLLCHEATTSAVHRAALRSDASRVTALTNLMSGRPARGIVNRLMRELGPLRADVPSFPHAAAALAGLRAEAERRGRGDFSPLWAGQNASGCRDVPAAELTRDLAIEWLATLH